MADDKGESGFTFLLAALGVADIAASAALYSGCSATTLAFAQPRAG